MSWMRLSFFISIFWYMLLLVHLHNFLCVFVLVKMAGWMFVAGINGLDWNWSVINDEKHWSILLQSPVVPFTNME